MVSLEMKFEHVINIEAPASRVWDALIDVEPWPKWTSSGREVEVMAESPLGLSSLVRIRQPRLAATIWQVADFEPGERFVWKSRAFGGPVRTGHRVTADQPGLSIVTLTIETGGLLRWLIDPLVAPIARRYIAQEAQGLKHACEAAR